jgi:hypothetical protein
MSTQLDRNFVNATLDNVRALANEVERLECYNRQLEAALTPEQLQAASEAGSKEWCQMKRITLE